MRGWAAVRNTHMLFHKLHVSFASAVAILVMLGGTAPPALAVPVKNIVLVHGAWVDGSGWKPVYEILTRDGYSVSVVQEPCTSLTAMAARSSLRPASTRMS